ncbi:hypothetical protein ACA910_006126 [Epithemia clementina (nom. ined.)]
MGIFKKPKSGGYRTTDDESNRMQQQEYILEAKAVETEAGTEDQHSVMTRHVSPKAKHGFFKSKGKRIKKKKNNFQRLSTSCSTPLNAYEPPGQDVFFPADDGDTKQVTVTDLSEPSTATKKTEAVSPTSTTNTDQEMVGLTTKNITFRKSRGPKELALLKHKHPSLTKEVKKASPIPTGFHKLSDEESVLRSPPPKLKGNKLYTLPPPSLLKSSAETTESEASADHNSTEQEYEPPPDFDHRAAKEQRHFSDASESGSSGNKTQTIEVVESSVAYTATNSTTQLESSCSSSSSHDGDIKSGGKFSDRGDTEFRQFVFDKQFSRIETVSVEKSNSGAGDPFLSAAAVLASKLQASAIDRYTATSTITSFSKPQQRDAPQSSTDRFSLVSESSRFPSPTFPTRESMKQTETHHHQSEKFSEFQKKRHVNIVADERSEDLRMARGQPTRSANQTNAKPPKAIVTSSEFTVVSNMSATHATTETYDRTEKSSLHHNGSLVIPEGKEQQDEDPFNVASVADDTFWDDAPDENSFMAADKSKIKYQGGQLRKSSSVDDALIASIRKATKRVTGPAAKKPDPSPRAMKTSLSDGANGSGRKWVFESPGETRDRSAKKKRTPMKSSRETGSSAKSPPGAPFSSPVEGNLSPRENGNSENKPPKDISTDENLANDGGSPTSSCATSVYEKVQQIEERRKMFRPSPRKSNGSVPFSPRQNEANSNQSFIFRMHHSHLHHTELEDSYSFKGENENSHAHKQQNGSVASHSFGSGIQRRPDALISALAGYHPPTSGARKDYPRPLPAVLEPPAETGPDSEELENPEDNIYTSSKSRNGSASFHNNNAMEENAEGQAFLHGASERRMPWQAAVQTTAGEKSIHSNPSGVPLHAIAASMLFQANPTESTRTLAPPINNREEEGVEMDDGVDEDLPDVPPAVHVSDSVDAVSSITEEASSFYHKSFQLWSKTAHNALNNIQRGTFARNPGQYRAPN